MTQEIRSTGTAISASVYAVTRIGAMVTPGNAISRASTHRSPAFEPPMIARGRLRTPRRTKPAQSRMDERQGRGQHRDEHPGEGAAQPEDRVDQPGRAAGCRMASARQATPAWVEPK